MIPLHSLATTVFLMIAASQPTIPSSQAPRDAASPVLDVLERIRQAVRACRIDDYATYWADGSTIFISNGNPLMPSQEYLGIWRQVCADGGGMKIGPVEEEVTVLAEGVALVTGSMGYTFTATDGEVHSGTSRTTTILREIEGEWKLVHAHGSELGVHGGAAE